MFGKNPRGCLEKIPEDVWKKSQRMFGKNPRGCLEKIPEDVWKKYQRMFGKNTRGCLEKILGGFGGEGKKTSKPLLENTRRGGKGLGIQEVGRNLRL